MGKGTEQTYTYTNGWDGYKYNGEPADLYMDDMTTNDLTSSTNDGSGPTSGGGE